MVSPHENVLTSKPWAQPILNWCKTYLFSELGVVHSILYQHSFSFRFDLSRFAKTTVQVALRGNIQQQKTPIDWYLFGKSHLGCTRIKMRLISKIDWRILRFQGFLVTVSRFWWAVRGTRRRKYKKDLTSVVFETVSETSHLCWNNETIRFKSSLTSIIIESTYLTLNMNKIWGCFKVQVGKKCILWGNPNPLGCVQNRIQIVGFGTVRIKKHFLTFTLSVNKIIIYQFSMFKSPQPR